MTEAPDPGSHLDDAEASTNMAIWTTMFPGRNRNQVAEVARRPQRRVIKTRLACDQLEGRALMATGLGTDYTLMGGQWNNSEPISFSVAADGAAWDDGGVNDLNAQLNAEFGNTSWQNTVAAALQTWAVAANLNFVPSSDGTYAWNTQGAGQGDPDFGDIRVAGYTLNNNAIAQTYGPPPNGYTAAGDVKLNTSYTFGPTGQWDLESVLIHEFGHSLGLGESPQPGAVMYSTYSGVRHTLSSYDVEGIQSIYGPRVADPFQAQGEATSSSSAVDITGKLNSADIAVVDGLSLDAIGDSEYFSVTAPALQGSTMIVNAVANGHSLMSPKVSVIDAATGATLAVAAQPAQYGDTASVTIPNAQAGHRYLIVVTGATQDEFSVGNYSLSAGFSGGTATVATPTPTPVVTPISTPIATTTTTTPTPTPTLGTTTTTTTGAPTTTTAGTVPIPTATVDPYAANNSFATAAQLGTMAGQSIISNVKLASAQDVRVFAFEPASSGLAFVASAHAEVVIGNSSGQYITSGTGLVGFQATAGARYFIVIMSPNNAPVADASFAVQVVPVTPTAVTTTTTVATTTTTSNQIASTGTTVKIKKKQKHR